MIYVQELDWSNIRLHTNNHFKWLIQNGVKTNVAKNHDCAYDRFVTIGYIPVAYDTASVFRFDQVYNLTKDLIKKVSDHYPIEITLIISPVPTTWITYLISCFC